jgi:hypothetical protein
MSEAIPAKLIKRLMASALQSISFCLHSLLMEEIGFSFLSFGKALIQKW